MKTLMIAAVVTLGVAPMPATAEPEDIRTYCQRVSRGSYRSEAFCVDSENEAYRALASRPPVEQRILDFCNRVSRSWQMMKFCIESEEQARAKLRR